MQPFKEQTFTLPALKGISQKTVEEHLKLYAGYVKHANLILERIAEYSADTDKHGYAISELQRRFSFEYCGIRNHEFYFSSLSGGASALETESPLRAQIVAQWGSFDAWFARFSSIALTRGVGWAMLYWDNTSKQLVNAWVDEQHLGQLADAQIVLALDMWEHSFVADYQPSGKKQYVADFFANLNWQVIEANFTKAQ